MMMMMMMLSLPLPECTCSAAVKPIAGEHVTSFAFIQSRLPSHANILGYNVKTEIVELHFEDDAAVQAFMMPAGMAIRGLTLPQLVEVKAAPESDVYSASPDLAPSRKKRPTR